MVRCEVVVIQGGLFTRYFLEEGIDATMAWRTLDAVGLSAFETPVRAAFAAFPTEARPSEADTENDLIFPVLRALGWEHWREQVPAALKGRSHIPDLLMFADAEQKRRAYAADSPAAAYRFGIAIVENKAWARPLDRAERRDQLHEGVPSTQILAYLSLAEVQSERAVRWGILTNGRHWRLYFQGARSRSEEFLDIDLAAALGLEGFADPADAAGSGVSGAGPDASPEAARSRWLKVFCLMFGRAAFLPAGPDGRSFHELALDEGRRWEERVARNLSDLVFGRIFPNLAAAITRAAARPGPGSPAEANVADAVMAPDLEPIRQATLILLYRLLFVLYAEDRDLLPVRDRRRYGNYSLYLNLREPIARRHDAGHAFATRIGPYYAFARQLFRAIGAGEPSLGIPPYNGGLFDPERAPVLERIDLPDADFAEVIEALSRLRDDGRPRWINYRDLSVQQLGSIYERLLEHELVAGADGLTVQPNPFARKGSGSYYTPDELVRLIVDRALAPLLSERRTAFERRAQDLADSPRPKAERLAELHALDPAAAFLDLKVCDPAMGSGHFLVTVVDILADQVLQAIADAPSRVPFADAAAPYVSPLVERIAAIRAHILDHAREGHWAVEEAQLDDRLIVRRMILKRVIYGVDKNPMAVELAKVALWLHTFTVGAPLSFLDHHLRAGDSLFGEWVRPVDDRLKARGALLINRYVTQAANAARAMTEIEELTDTDIAEVRNSAAKFAEIGEATRPLTSFLSLIHAERWLDLTVSNNGAAPDPDKEPERHRRWRRARAWNALLDHQFGDPVAIADGRAEPVLPEHANQLSLLPEDRPHQGDMLRRRPIDADTHRTAIELLAEARTLIAEETFLHWEPAFPGVWRNWLSAAPEGGFDAVIGNPPWDRIKLQEVEWFAARRPDIAHAATAADRKRMIRQLKAAGDPLYRDYEQAASRAEAAARVARSCGGFPDLSAGDINIYGLFVERAMRLVKPDGLVGLLTPSGIAADKSASAFFRTISTTGRLSAVFDFENRGYFFPDVHQSFKLCTFFAGGPARRFDQAVCAFFLRDPAELADPDRVFTLTPADFAAVNPNTGTAPVFRTARDAATVTAIYRRLPVLVDRREAPPQAVWPVRYFTMFHMTNDSHRFRTVAQLDADGYYRSARNRWKKGPAEFVPLYEGKMVQAYDHRAASVTVNPESLHRPAQPRPATDAQHRNPDWLPEPQFWVPAESVAWPKSPADAAAPAVHWSIGFKDVTAPTNVRTMIAAVVPLAGFGNTLPLLGPDGVTAEGEPEPPEEPAGPWPVTAESIADYRRRAPLWLANLNALVLDYVARQKVQGQHLNWYIVEQLPVLPDDRYDAAIGATTARALVRDHVLRLTYTAHDLAPFARDQGHDGPPFLWDAAERRHLRARLDALFFLLYGIGREDAAHILDTFPILRREDEAAHGRFLTRDLVLGYMSALAAGDATTRIAEPA